MKAIVIDKEKSKVTAEFPDCSEIVINGRHIQCRSDDGRIGKVVFTLDKTEMIKIKK